MNKGIIVVDMPSVCEECSCFQYDIQYGKYCDVSGGNLMDIDCDEEKPDWCPIKPIPEKMQSEGISIYAIAWNECLDEIINKSGV